MITLLFLFFISVGCQEETTTPIGTINPKPQSEMKYLALGDSYTIGESVAPEYRWPNQLRDSLESKGIVFDPPEIIARTGWRTDDLISAAVGKTNQAEYDLVSLLIGVNNQFQGVPIDRYRKEFEELLLFALEQAGGNKDRVVVLSIPDYGCTPFGASRAEQIAEEIDQYNAINEEITVANGVTYIQITAISREAKNDPSLIADDNLHPSGSQYTRWVQEILRNEEFIGKLH